MGKINKYCNIYDIEGKLITHVDENGVLPNQYKIALAKLQEYAKQKEEERQNTTEDTIKKLQEVNKDVDESINIGGCKEIEMEKYVDFEEVKAA